MYNSNIWSLLRKCSILKASNTSLNLRVRVFSRGQEKIARHLHGNGAGAFAGAAGCQVGKSRTRHAEIIDTTMLVKAVVLGGEDGEAHRLGHRIDL